MSVLKNLRKTSRFEFEYNYTKFYAEFKNRVSSIPNRRKELVGKPLLDTMNTAYNSILRINQYLFTKKSYRKNDRESLIIKAIEDVYAIQKPLFVYWNIQRTSSRKQARWCSFLDKELSLLNDLLKESKMQHKFMIIDWESVCKIEFINTMCELHKTIHTKLVKANEELKSTETPFLAELIDTALYELLRANDIYPETKDKYLERENRIESVLEIFNSMAIPLCSYFEIMNENIKEQYKIYDLIEKEENLLNGLLKSDKKHFSHLLNEK